MCARATLTTLVSIAPMRDPKSTETATSHFPAPRGRPAAAAAEADERVPTAMRTRCPPGRLAPSPRIDRGFGGQTDLEGLAAQIGRIERDAHRHQLHHLDEVPGRIIRREQRGRRPRRGADAL